MNTYKQSVSFN